MQKVLNDIENLSGEDKKILFELLECQFDKKLSSKLEQEIEEVRQEYQEGKVKFDSVTDFLKELDN